MKKLSAILIMLLLLVVSPSFAAVGVKVDGVNVETATDLGFIDAGSTISSDGSTTTINLLMSGLTNGDATTMTTNDTAVSVAYGLVQKAIGTYVSYPGTMANSTPGKIVTIIATERQGSGTFVLTPTTRTGFNTITFDAVGDSVSLLYLNSTNGWIVIGGSGVVVAL